MQFQESEPAHQLDYPLESPLLDKPLDALSDSPLLHHQPFLQPESYNWREQQREVLARSTPPASNPLGNQQSRFAEHDVSDDVIPTPDEPERRSFRGSYAEEGFDESRSEWHHFQDAGYEQFEAEQQGVRNNQPPPDLHVLEHRQGAASQLVQTPQLVPVGPSQEAEEGEPQGRRKGYKCGICGQPKKGHVCQGRARESGGATVQVTAPSLPPTPLLERGFSQLPDSSTALNHTATDTPRHHPPRPERQATPPVENPLRTKTPLRPASPRHQPESPTLLYQHRPSGTLAARPANQLSAGGRSISRQLFQGFTSGGRMGGLREAGPSQRPASPASSSSSKEDYRRGGQGARDRGVQTLSAR